MFGIGWQELLLIALIVLLLFGAKRVPELMKGIGKGMRELKRGLHDVDAPKQDDGAKVASDSAKGDGERTPD